MQTTRAIVDELLTNDDGVADALCGIVAKSHKTAIDKQQHDHLNQCAYNKAQPCIFKHRAEYILYNTHAEDKQKAHVVMHTAVRTSERSVEESQ